MLFYSLLFTLLVCFAIVRRCADVDPKQSRDEKIAQGLARINVDKVAEAMQVSATNPMVGLQGRTALLVRLSTALTSNPKFFGDDARPGNMLGKCTLYFYFLHPESHCHPVHYVIHRPSPSPSPLFRVYGLVRALPRLSRNHTS